MHLQTVSLIKNCYSGCFLEKLFYSKIEKIHYSTGASDRCFCPIFNKSSDHLETLLTIHKPKKFCQLGHCAGLQCPVPNLNAPKGPLSYYPKSIMPQFQICYHSQFNVSQKTKTNINFRGQAWVRPPQSAESGTIFYPISIMPEISTQNSGIFQLTKNAKTNNNVAVTV